MGEEATKPSGDSDMSGLDSLASQYLWVEFLASQYLWGKLHNLSLSNMSKCQNWTKSSTKRIKGVCLLRSFVQMGFCQLSVLIDKGLA